MAESTISFARGAPSADILPHDAVREAAAHALESDWERALSYGTGRGHPGLCEWIAELHGAQPEQVMVTNGSMEAAALLFRHLVSAGDRVIVEQPTYDRTLLLLRQADAELVGAPLEADGVDPAAVEAACADGEVKLAHIIPNFHNPAGCTLSLEKRTALVQLAADNGFLLFEDDPYRLISFEKTQGKTMLEMDTAERVIHASSFSKSVSPGVRVGYLVGPTEQIATLAKRANETYISPNMLAESIVFELCRSGGLDENLKVVNAALRERRDALVDALREHIPEARVRCPRGRLLPLARPERRRRHQGAARRGEGGGRHLRRGPRLHDGGRKLESAALLRPGSRRRGRRGHPAPRSRARAPAGGGESCLEPRRELQLGRELPGRTVELRRSRAASSRSATRFPNRKGRL